MAAPAPDSLEARVHDVIAHVVEVTSREPGLIDLHTRARTVFERAEERAAESAHVPTSDVVVIN